MSQRGLCSSRCSQDTVFCMLPVVHKYDIREVQEVCTKWLAAGEQQLTCGHRDKSFVLR